MVAEKVGVYAALLAATEMGLGSALHALRVPLRGQLLSLNQICLLIQASKERCSPFSISMITALMKSLSPIGNKVTPMLAIAMQGALFHLGILFFGYSLVGRVIGALLSSLWAFAQPLLLYQAIFGDRLFSLIPEPLWIYGLLGLIALKSGLVIVLGFLAPRIYPSWIERCSRYAEDVVPRVALSPGKGALKELVRPFFLVVTLLSGLTAFWMEETFAAFAWGIARPVALGFLLFWVMRFLPVERLASFVEARVGGITLRKPSE